MAGSRRVAGGNPRPVAVRRPTLLEELKRRNVLRSAALYAGAVWALSQGIAQLSPALGLPDFATRWFLIACVIGFPLWIAFSYYFAITPQGIVREDELAPGTTHSIARKLDIAIIAVLALAVVLLASGYFVRSHAPAGALTEEADTGPFNPPADSLVVLPFKNLSGDKKQQYFSDGITEELTDALGQNAALRVIAWATASTLRDLGLSPNAIGRRLNVANVLNGSILRSGDDVRITAELVDTRNGVQLWSSHYDGSFADVFKMQDEVSASIAGALKIKFARTDLPEVGTHNAQAHELVLKGRALARSVNAADLKAARNDLEQAILLDPDYAEARASLALVMLSLTARSDLPLATTLPKARAQAEKAVALAPRSAHAWVALAVVEMSSQPPELDNARAAFKKALEIDPSSAPAHLNYALVLPLKEALEQEKQATVLDPANQAAWNNLSVFAQDLGDWPQAIRAMQMVMKLNPRAVDAAFALALAYQRTHQYDKMVAPFDLVKPASPVDKAQVDAGRLAYRSINDPSLRPQALVAVQALAPEQSNPDVGANMLQLYLVLGQTEPALKLVESSCAAQPVSCGDLAVNPMYTPLHGNPTFEALSKKYTTVTAE